MTEQSDRFLEKIFGAGFERCPETGRPYENGSGCLSKEQQTANFVRERDRLADIPKRGESCPQTRREYEFGHGAFTKTKQTEDFLLKYPLIAPGTVLPSPVAEDAPKWSRWWE